MIRNLNISLQTLFLCLVLFSCKESSDKIRTFDTDEGVLVNIKYPAGDNAKLFNKNFLPAPFNLGYHGNNSTEFIVLNDRMGKGSSIKVMPIATLELIDTVNRSFIVAVPSDSTKRILKIENFGMLATGHPQVKNLIEYWIKGNCENQNVRIKWASEQKALELVEG